MNRSIPRDIGSYPFDLIIVGAGINGAGIARDAAMRGLRVLLLDKGDISDGTTQWSTRLIHGGLRYLEYYEFGLVRESLREREILLHIAPHLVRPLGFMVPVYERSKRGPRTIRLGMIAYDALSFDKSLPNHRMFSAREALEREPGLNPDGLLGAAFYYDAQAEYAERLAVENAVSAARHGALVLTYAKVERLLHESGGVAGVEFTDLLGGGRYTARAPVTVNVAGPWVDEVLSGAGYRGPRLIGGTKGSHIVVDPFPGAPREEALYVEARRDGRPYFIVPWNGRYLIGTTDLRYEGDLDRVEASEEEIEYLLDETNHVIPRASLSREDVLFTYSGVRPLPYQPEGAEGSITRRHIIHDHARDERPTDGLISIVGGKLTTYRNLARETVDLVYEKLRLPDPGCKTARIPLPGGLTDDFDSFAAAFKATSGLSETLSERLLRVYGTRAPEVLAYAGEDPSLRMPLSPRTSQPTGLIGAEVLYAFEREMAQTLSDLLLRRSMAGMGPRVALDVDEAAAEVAQRYLGWSPDRAKEEVRRYREFVRRYHPRDFRRHKTLKA
ncbi:glycerol-3-phosphate dehydrogenase [Rubrobacter xylanophilus]|uniref:Glycerol-3-phosphate dehydrogenase n=1 Tax=Rubrobacter xylanophilus TaxID=49319 RepID=A0A510HIN6_9ACTN|nr:glycerol-3-phosphate dehydrogenase [Rubrobacter xylanophilus]BBL78523.1 glycerol-3-phosphate dehydrogenase [Rubrobacter xylanophilus]